MIIVCVRKILGLNVFMNILFIGIWDVFIFLVLV